MARIQMAKSLGCGCTSHLYESLVGHFLRLDQCHRWLVAVCTPDFDHNHCSGRNFVSDQATDTCWFGERSQISRAYRTCGSYYALRRLARLPAARRRVPGCRPHTSKTTDAPVVNCNSDLSPVANLLARGLQLPRIMKATVATRVVRQQRHRRPAKNRPQPQATRPGYRCLRFS